MPSWAATVAEDLLSMATRSIPKVNSSNNSKVNSSSHNQPALDKHLCNNNSPVFQCSLNRQDLGKVLSRRSSNLNSALFKAISRGSMASLLCRKIPNSSCSLRRLSSNLSPPVSVRWLRHSRLLRQPQSQRAGGRQKLRKYPTYGSPL